MASARAGTGGRPLAAKQLGARLEQVRARVEGTTAGRLQRRAMELDLIHQAMVLAALTMTLLIPALITLGALIPLGDPHGIAPLVGAPARPDRAGHAGRPVAVRRPDRRAVAAAAG